MIILTLLLFSVPVTIEVWQDYKSITEGRGDNHRGDMLPRALMILVVAFVNTWIMLGRLPEWDILLLYSIWLAVAWFWLTFDYTLNAMRKIVWYYLGTTSWLDKRLRKLHPVAVALLKLFFFGMAIKYYYGL